MLTTLPLTRRSFCKKMFRWPESSSSKHYSFMSSQRLFSFLSAVQIVWFSSLKLGPKTTRGTAIKKKVRTLHFGPRNTMLMLCTGGIRGAYILRTLGSVEFNYESAKSHLINLDLDSLRHRTLHFNTVAGDEAEGGADMNDHIHAKLLQLATWINLDSRFSVSSISIHSDLMASLTRRRWAAPVQSSATYSAERLPNTCPMTRMPNSHSESGPLKCSLSETRFLLMLTP